MKFIKSIFEFFSTSLEPVTSEEFFTRIHNFTSVAFTESELDDINYILNGKYEINQDLYWLKETTHWSEIYASLLGVDKVNSNEKFKELVPNSYINLQRTTVKSKYGLEMFKTDDSWLYMIVYSNGPNQHYIIDIEMEWDKFLEFLNELTS
jgi:hypothetical protein